jgi:hypothetical protein
LADTLEAVQKIAQAGPYAFHRVAVHTGTVRGTTRILARTMVDRPLLIGGLGEMGDVLCIGEELSPAFRLGGDDRFDRRAAPLLQHFQLDLRSCQLLAQNTHPHTSPEKGRKALLERLCQGMQRVEVDTDHPAPPPPNDPGHCRPFLKQPHQAIAI